MIKLKNCFRLDTKDDKTVTHPVRFGDTYHELQRVNLSNGVIEKLVEVEYPHTPERVNSYCDIADYKRDPFTAVANGTPRQNLGDVRGVQEVLSMDSSDRAEQIATLQKAIETLQNMNKAEPKVEPKVEPKAEPKAEPQPIIAGGNE